MMEICRINASDAARIVPLVAEFRVLLRSLRGEAAQPDLAAAEQEVRGFLQAGFPVFAAEDCGTVQGYVVCRVEEPCLWVEHLYVREAFRRIGVASALFGKAEEIAHSMGEETVFNYVHPNNHAMIGFLRSRGYTVLNLVEIRKPYPGEKNTSVIRVGDHLFDY